MSVVSILQCLPLEISVLLSKLVRASTHVFYRGVSVKGSHTRIPQTRRYTFNILNSLFLNDITNRTHEGERPIIASSVCL